ncbi:MAG: hypothetical protein KF865_01765 [Bdellovibrionaceae bacterium]|nr:hypothetical protein [Pseudobdellovibrionaceae bacterium]
MNSQWMTTLLSKGIELEQSLRKNIGQAQSQLKKELESRGLRLSPADLAALLEEMAPAASRAALSSALDYLRPFSAGLGFRVSRLSDTQIEMIVPARSRNCNEEGHLHEGALVTAGIEAAKLLWTRHAPLGEFKIQVTSAAFESHRPTRADARVRLELVETAREILLSQLRKNREVTSETALRFVDESEQSIGDLRLTLLLRYTPSLEAPEG